MRNPTVSKSLTRSDRHRFKVRKWDPEESPKPEPPQCTPVETHAVGRLAPALHPRRPTVEEFSSHTPEKLELIDGHIPGEENLLLLVLTSMGLRRAAQLVGPKLWRSAAAPVRWTIAGPATGGRRKRKL